MNNENTGTNLFTGVVEDINDPEQMGRVRVRIFGAHSADATQLPTSTLPWATVMMPVTSASLGGIGTSATGLLQGSWVTGIFRDGEDAQDPMILGSIPGKSTKPKAGAETFADPTGEHPYRDGPDTPSAGHSTNYTASAPHIKKKALAVSGIKTGVAPALPTIDPLTPAPAARGEWSVPSLDETSSPVYPFNHVTQTLAGHVIERDDTPGRERLSEMHCSGTHVETIANGSRKVVVVGNGYRVVLHDDNVYIEGSCNVTIGGNARTLIRGDYALEVEGNYSENIRGSKIQKIDGSHKSEIAGEVASNIGSARKVTVGGADDLNVAGASTFVTGGNHDQTVSGDHQTLTLGATKQVTAGNTSIASGGALDVASAGGVDLTATGNMTIKGAFIDLN
jgi:hypothetical protein